MAAGPGGQSAGPVLPRQHTLPATAVRRRARVVVLAAILSGLFLMHGTAAAGGCQDAAAMPATSAMTVMQPSAPPAAGGHGARSVPGSGSAASHHAPVPVTAAPGVIAQHAAVCLFTAPRRIPAVAPLAAAGVLVALRARRPGRIAQRARPYPAHGPPGRMLLTRLCVTQT